MNQGLWQWIMAIKTRLMKLCWFMKAAANKEGNVEVMMQTVTIVIPLHGAPYSQSQPLQQWVEYWTCLCLCMEHFIQAPTG